MIDMSKADQIITRALGIVESQLQSSLVPEAQKTGLVLMQAQLIGSYALLEIRNALVGESEPKESILQ